jgi:Family of unknown function (DUF6155)
MEKNKVTQPKINLTHLKQHLKNCSQAELIADIAELFKKFPAVKDYYQIKLYPEADKEIIDKYKKIIQNQFFPSRGYGKAKISVAEKAISDYKKICKTEAGLIDMMLFYVEQGVKFTNAYGDINEDFYVSMEDTYEETVKIIVQANLKDIFQARCQKIVSDTSDIGWGFPETLSDVYEEYF